MSADHWPQLSVSLLAVGPILSHHSSIVLTVPADAEAASWHLDSVEVQVGDGGGGSSSFAAPTYFACHRWLDARSGYRAELAPSARNPRQEEVEYKVG